MSEISKVTTPIIPKENPVVKSRPMSEQLFELNNPGRVNRAQGEKQQVSDREAGGQMRENLGRAAMQPLLRNIGELMYNVQKMVALLEMGISTSDVLKDPEFQEMFRQIFTSPEELARTLLEQDESAVIFRGEAFDILRSVAARFTQYPRVHDALVNLLKAFEYNVNTPNSLKSIIYNCENLLDYMFARDREQFAGYLDSLIEMLIPELMIREGEEDALAAQLQQQAAKMLPMLDENGNPVLDAQGNPVMQEALAEEEPQQSAGQMPHLEGREAAQVLKNNLLPLLGEIVVKYHQNGKIRDIVMVVVHNIVRVDKGTPEALRDSVAALTYELRRVANLPEGFAQHLLEALRQSAGDVKASNNLIMERLATVILETLQSPATDNPAALRQAENLLLSLLQNQSSMMDVLHFMLPMETEDDRMFAELYVDPDSDEGKGRNKDDTRKLFLSVESENHGTLELCFLQCGDRVEFSMWCPEILMGSMNALRRTIGDIMQIHGYTMSGFKVQELKRPHTIAEVFPRLLNRKVGIDVRI